MHDTHARVPGPAVNAARPISFPLRALALLIVLLAAFGITERAHADTLPELRLDGASLVDTQGEPVVLRGVNFGGWLLIEPWMLGVFDDRLPDQHSVIELLRKRFGDERARDLLETYRDAFAQPSDFKMIRSFGFNCVRLPIHYSILEQPVQGEPLGEEAFARIDFAINEAARNGMYTVIDLHGAPGGQSVDAPSGRVGENDLWTDPDAQDRTAAIWRAFAERYGDHPGVAAYDLLNEPYGDFTEAHHDALRALTDRLYQEVRAIDKDTPVLLPGTTKGIDFLGDPRERGMRGVGFTEHFYPGIYGGEAASLEVHSAFFATTLADRANVMEDLDAWYFIGEFNPVFESAGGARMMRHYFDAFAVHGWGATSWSYKLLRPEGGVHGDNWYMVTNRDPWRIDLFNDSFETLKKRFASIEGMPLSVDEPLRRSMSGDTPGAFALPAFDRHEESGTVQPPHKWEALSVGGSAVPTLKQNANAFTITGGGLDIFGARDSFGYIARPAETSGSMSIVVSEFDATDRYAKTGLMLRPSADPDAPHAFVHIFPSGRTMLAMRDAAGSSTAEVPLAVTGFPARLNLAWDAGTVRVSVVGPEGATGSASIDRPAALADEALIGYAVLAHAEHLPATATFEGRFGQSDASPDLADVARRSGYERAANGSFETVGEAQDRASGWNRWGDWINREEGWSPVDDGGAILAYHHWRIRGEASSGVWQDFRARDGSFVRARVLVNVDRGERGVGLDGARVTLKLEHPHPDGGGQMLTLASRSWDASVLAEGDAWSSLEIGCRVVAEDVRLVLEVTPGNGRRDGAIKFDSVSIQEIAGG